jgi:hypothetical protein
MVFSGGLCREVISENAFLNVKKYKRLKLGGGHVYDCSSV